MRTRDFLRCFLTLAMATAAGLAFAQAPYPARPIQVVVGFPGGGGLDVATRVVTNGMAEEGVSPVVIVNRPGASATIAAAQVARAAPDGYTLLLSSSANMGIAPHLYPKLPYDPVADFVAVAQFGVGQNVVYASQASGIRSFRDLQARLRAEPGKFNYASPGAGTTAHLTFEMIKAREKLFVVHVPFRGSPAAISAVIANELEIGVDAIGPTLSFVKSGRIVALAQTGSRRSALLPDVPTFEELGLRGMPSGTYLGLSAPAQTPEPVLAALRTSIKRFLAKPDAVAQLALAGFEPAYVEGTAFSAAMRTDAAQWGTAVKYSGATGN